MKLISNRTIRVVLDPVKLVFTTIDCVPAYKDFEDLGVPSTHSFADELMLRSAEVAHGSDCPVLVIFNTAPVHIVEVRVKESDRGLVSGLERMVDELFNQDGSGFDESLKKLKSIIGEALTVKN